ncbi:hypothetical protein [Haloarcula sebkhae]|nr:hypothetical protein [Haloarcula sebkhae]
MATADAGETTVDQLATRVEQLAQQLARKDDRIDALEQQLADHEERIDGLKQENEALQERVDELEDLADVNSSKIKRNRQRASDIKNRLGEIQSRELEKGAHLLEAHIDTGRLDVDGDRIECFDGDDGQRYARLPGEADPLGRSGSSSLAMGDLLPIQQLARMDDDMLAASTSSLPAQLAAKAWREREAGRLWNNGSGSVRHYVDASDLRTWIRREEQGVSETYAKKLVSRTLDALQELTKDRLCIERRSRRKDGLNYKERRVVLPADSAIPGETTGQEE